MSQEVALAQGKPPFGRQMAGTGSAVFALMSEVLPLPIGFLKDELLKAAARKREQAARSHQLRLIERGLKIKSSRPDNKDDGST
jgi:hypothetical protein